MSATLSLDGKTLTVVITGIDGNDDKLIPLERAISNLWCSLTTDSSIHDTIKYTRKFSNDVVLENTRKVLLSFDVEVK